MIKSTLKVQISPESSSLLLQKGVDYLNYIRTFKGCIDIQLHLNVEQEGSFSFHSNWDSLENLDQFLHRGTSYELIENLNLRSLITKLEVQLVSHHHQETSIPEEGKSSAISRISKQISNKLKILDPPTAKYASSHLSKKQIEKFLIQIKDHMETYQPFLRQDLTLVSFAKEVGLHSHHVSRVINEKLQMNFSDFINSYRVELSKSLLKQDLLKRYTISGIGNEAGFNSRSAFYNAFKKFTGMSPGEFITTINENVQQVA